MTKIEQIEECISRAERRESKITPLALAVPGLTSLNIRHLLNNLGAISTRLLEVGSHKGCTFCSTIFKNDNIISAISIDSFESDLTNEDKAEPQFLDNVTICKPSETKFRLIKGDSFSVVFDNILRPIDIYIYDGNHSEEAQRKGVTHFISLMADEFIFLVDDYDWPEVQKGTMDGIAEAGCEILFEKVFIGNDHDNDGWWNGFVVFLLKKKP